MLPLIAALLATSGGLGATLSSANRNAQMLASAESSLDRGNYEKLKNAEIAVFEPLVGQTFEDGVIEREETPIGVDYYIRFPDGTRQPASAYLAQQGVSVYDLAAGNTTTAGVTDEGTEGLPSDISQWTEEDLLNYALGSGGLGNYSTSSDWGEQQAAYYNRELDELTKQRQFDNYLNWNKFMSEQSRDPLDWITSAFRTRGVTPPSWTVPTAFEPWLGGTPFPWLQEQEGEEIPIQPRKQGDGGTRKATYDEAMRGYRDVMDKWGTWLSYAPKIERDTTKRLPPAGQPSGSVWNYF